MDWKNYTSLPLKFRNERVFDGCGISGFINIDGTRDKGSKVIDMLCILHDRENGLGAGFAAYGVYPNYEDYYAISRRYNRPIKSVYQEIMAEALKQTGNLDNQDI